MVKSYGVGGCGGLQDFTVSSRLFGTDWVLTYWNLIGVGLGFFGDWGLTIWFLGHTHRQNPLDLLLRS